MDAAAHAVKAAGLVADRRMLKAMLVAPIVFAFLTGLAPIAHPAEPVSRLVAPAPIPGEEARVWRVAEDGRIVPLKLRYLDVRGGVISPDQAHVAFVQEGDLWLFEVDRAKVRQMTWDGRPYAPPLNGVFVEIVGWAPDGRSLVYHVTHSVPFGCEEPPVYNREAAYGFYLLDVRTGSSRVLEPSARVGDHLLVWHLAWLPDGSFLVSVPQVPAAGAAELLRLRPSGKEAILFPSLPMPPPYEKVLLRVGPGGEPIRTVADLQGHWGVVEVSQNGERMVANLTFDGKDQPSQLWSVDLRDGSADQLTLPQLAERLRLSPSGQRVASVHQVFANGGKEHWRIVVDDRPIHAQTPYPQFAWIGERALVVWDGKTIAVLDADTGAERGRRPLP